MLHILGVRLALFAEPYLLVIGREGNARGVRFQLLPGRGRAWIEGQTRRRAGFLPQLLRFRWMDGFAGLDGERGARYVTEMFITLYLLT